jgi:hypothetical protein
MNNVAEAINNAGQIVGISDRPWHAPRVYIVTNDINARGQVIGCLVRCELQLPRVAFGTMA